MTPLVYPDWRSKVVFSGEGPQPQILVENEKLKVVVAGLEAGQRIPAHPESLAMYHFLDGRGWMTVAGERVAVSAGATIVAPQGAPRGIEADTQLAFLAARIA